MFLYMDEAGDFGINKGNRYYVVSIVLIKNSSQAEKVITKAKNEIKNEHRLNINCEVKFNKLSNACRHTFMKRIKAESLPFFVAYIDTHNIKEKEMNEVLEKVKLKHSTDLRGKMHYLFLLVVLQELFEKIKDKNITIIGDDGLPNFVKEQTGKVTKELAKKFKKKIKVRFKRSKAYDGIQIADLIAGAYFKNLKGVGDFYAHIKNPLLEMPVNVHKNAMSITHYKKK